MRHIPNSCPRIFQHRSSCNWKETPVPTLQSWCKITLSHFRCWSSPNARHWRCDYKPQCAHHKWKFHTRSTQNHPACGKSMCQEFRPVGLAEFIPITNFHLLQTFRNIDKLPAHVPRDVINSLKSFPSLSSHEKIMSWKDACSTSPYKEVVVKMFFEFYFVTLSHLEH